MPAQQKTQPRTSLVIGSNKPQKPTTVRNKRKTPPCRVSKNKEPELSVEKRKYFVQRNIVKTYGGKSSKLLSEEKRVVHKENNVLMHKLLNVKPSVSTFRNVPYQRKTTSRVLNKQIKRVKEKEKETQWVPTVKPLTPQPPFISTKKTLPALNSKQKIIAQKNTVNAYQEKFTETDIVANAFSMFVAGFETVSNALSLFLYEIALNKNIQDKLREEMLSKLSKHDGKINNELLMDINYLDMVLAETLRKYPFFFGLFRKATKTYHVPNDSLIIEKGQQIIIPTRSLHFDPKYFENPNVFDPERFSPENKVKIVKGTYLPFGDGGRICIGKRFAVLEIKLALVEILTKFEVAPCKKTEIPLTFSKMSLAIQPKYGIWLAFKKITI